jgi:hypothetical protein
LADIFISYAREDVDHARAFAELLTPLGWTVWWDRKILAGKIFSRVIEGELQTARCVMVIWSSHSVASEWVQNEAAEGAARGILIPVLIEDVQIPFEFRRVQATSMIGWHRGMNGPEVDDLVASLSLLLGRPPGQQTVVPEDEPPVVHRQPAKDSDPAAAAEATAEIPTRSAPPKPVEAEMSSGGRLKWAVVAVLALLILIWIVWPKGPGSVERPTASDTKGEVSQTTITDTTATVRRGSVPLSHIVVTTLEPPDFKRAPVSDVGEPSGIALRQLSAVRNRIIDDEQWLTANGLTLPYMAGIAIEASEFAPKSFDGKKLIRVIRSDERLLLIYGVDYASGLLLLSQRIDNREFEYALDFSRYQLAPANAESNINFVRQEINYARQIGNILYVSHGHNTYARSSLGMNAYVSAIDLSTKKAIWHSSPLVSNASTFEVFENYLITGYGFSAEPDYLYVLRIDSGAVDGRIPVNSGPSYILRKDTRLYVRTYDMNYLFQIAVR